MASSVGDANWVSVHVYYQGDLNRVLLTAVRPALGRLVAQELVDQWFFVRYWAGGPHLRLRALPSRASYTSSVRSELVDSLSVWLSANPSPNCLDPAQYRAFADQMAAVEDLSSAPSELRRNNTVETVVYSREEDLYGSGPALETAERHFATSTDLALDLLAKTARNQGKRMGSALSVLALTMSACQIEPAPLADWLTSTWNRWWAAGRRPPGVPSVPFEVEPEVQVVDHVRALWNWGQVAASGRGDDGTVDIWMRSLRELRASLLAERVLPVPHASSPLAPSAEPYPSRDGAVIPALLRCAHLYNNRIGIVGAAEGRLFALATRSLYRIEGSDGRTR